MAFLGEKAPPTKEPVRKIGFYGCVGKVVRLEGNGVTFPRVMRIKCPGCGHTHVVRPAWRKYIEKLDADRTSIEVELDAQV